MRIAFIGDVHGGWDDLYNALDRIPEDAMVIQVGDFGFYPWALVNLALDRPVHFVDGNHEHFPFLQERVNFSDPAPQIVRDFPNLIYLPRGLTLNIEGVVFGFMGGANSVDRKARQSAALFNEQPETWFPQEIPTEVEHARLLCAPRLDVIVSHDAPAEAYDGGYIPLNGRWKADDYDRLNRGRLQTLLEMKKPESWVHGHFHNRYRAKIQGCDVVGLGMDADVIFYDTEIRRFIY